MFHILVGSTVVQLEFYFFVYNVGFMGYDFHRTFFMSSLCCIIHGIIFLVLGYSDMNIGSRYGKTKGLLA